MITSKFLLVIGVLHFPRISEAQFECSLNDKFELCDSLYNDNSTLVSAQSRNFGGKEAIDYPKAFNAVFGAPGWLTQGLEAFSDINFHLLGYTALGFTYNFGEGRKNPNKPFQKYLDQIFGPTAIASSALRALRNPLFAFALRTYLDLIFFQKDMSTFISAMHLNVIRDTLLSEPWLHAKIFRDVCSFFFTTIGWTTYYIWWKWSIKEPIIAGRKKKRSVIGEDQEKILLAQYFEDAYKVIIQNMEETESRKDSTFSTNGSHSIPIHSNMDTCSSEHGTCLALGEDQSKAFGDYQYFLSFGGDQYLDIPLAIDAAYGTRGLIVQMGHFLSQVSYEVTGYAAMGFMYNGVYRTMIADNESRKFLDTFVGPTVSLASMMRIFRNGLFSLSTRIGLGLFVPISRARTLYLLQNFTFTLFKNTIFNELYLHQRIWRHIFENGCGIMGLSTYYAVFRFKKAYLDPPPEKTETTTIAPATPVSYSKPNFNRNDFEVTQFEGQTYQNNYTYPLYGDDEDNFYDYSYQSQPTYEHTKPSYNFETSNDELHKVENNILTSFKSILSKLKDSGNFEGNYNFVTPSP